MLLSQNPSFTELNLKRPLVVDTSRFRHTHDTQTHSALSAGRSLRNTVLLQSRRTLKPSKLLPLEVGRHGGDKAKLPRLCFPSSLLHMYSFLCSESSGVLSLYCTFPWSYTCEIFFINHLCHCMIWHKWPWNHFHRFCGTVVEMGSL